MLHSHRVAVAVLAIAFHAVTHSVAQAQATSDSSVVRPAGALRAFRMRSEGEPAFAPGASVMSIDSTEIMASAGATLSEALQARLPGLSVLQSDGSTTSGARVRLRGPNSMLVTTEPVVIVDGIRIDAAQEVFHAGSAVRSSRLDDIARQDVARIDVLPGPAAATLFGPGASAGALVITTKRGRPGPLHWNARAESRLALVPSHFPANYRMNGVSTSNGQPAANCDITVIAAQQCTPQRLEAWNPLERASPFRSARTGTGSVMMSGGTRQTDVYLSAAGERTLGISDGDDLGRASVRGNLQQRIGDAVAIGLLGNYTKMNANFAEPLSIQRGLIGSATDDANRGFIPSPFVAYDSRAKETHWLIGGSAAWQIVPWLSVTARVGRDHVGERDDFADTTLFVGGGGPRGLDELRRTTRVTNTFSASATATHLLWASPQIESETSAGYDRWSTRYDASDFQTSGGLISSSEQRMRTRMDGPWIREQLAIGDRLDVAAALRWENDQFFAEEGGPLRSMSASWMVGQAGPLRSVRLRGAYGEAQGWFGNDPDAFFSTIFLPSGGSPVTPSERASEIEGGVDARVGERMTLALTAFRATTSKLLVVGPGAPSSSSTSTVLASSAGMQNQGVELLAAMRLLDLRQLHWDATLALGAMRNRVRSLGGFPSMVSSSWRTIPGYPLNGYWAHDYSYDDANNDGIISPSEVHIADSATFSGSALPTREASLRSTLNWGSRLSMGFVLDHRGGYEVENLTAYYRCGVGTCRASQDPAAPLDEQARAVIALTTGTHTRAFIESAAFVKLREVTLRWALPETWTGAIGSRSGAITLAARNLATWTSYRGLDPELNGRGFDDLPRQEFFQTPLTRQFVLRLDIGGR